MRCDAGRCRRCHGPASAAADAARSCVACRRECAQRFATLAVFTEVRRMSARSAPTCCLHRSAGLVALALAAAATVPAVSIRAQGQPAAQAAAPDAPATPAEAVLGTYKWRSIGPNRGGRSIAVVGREGPPARGLLRRRRRRPVEDHRRRQQLGAGHRRPDHQLVGRRGRRVASRTPTSSTSAWASRASAATSCRATASTSRPTPARRGRTSASRNVDAISKIRIHPTNPDIVYVASFGLYYGPSDERGVFKSTDGGKTLEARAVPRRQDRRRRHRRSTARTPTCCTRRCGRPTASNTRCRAAAPAAASSSRTDGGETWTEITRNPGLPAGHGRPHRRGR